jgi:hypothetical protein
VAAAAALAAASARSAALAAEGEEEAAAAAASTPSLRKLSGAAAARIERGKSTAAAPDRRNQEAETNRSAVALAEPRREGKAAAASDQSPRVVEKRESTANETGTRTVAVVVTITSCDSFPPDGVAVLQYSVMKHQKELLRGSRYRYSFYAIHHPSARACSAPLADLNFTLLERESPVDPKDIRGSLLRSQIAWNGT